VRQAQTGLRCDLVDGRGLWFTVWALYLTRQVHLSLAHAGLAMSVSVWSHRVPRPDPAGTARRPTRPQGVYRLLLILEAIATLGFAFCSATWQVVVIASARRLLTTPGSGPRPSPAHCGSNRVHRLTRAFVGRITHGISRAVIRFVAPAAPV
jgi:hypothetical protein